MVQGDGHGPGGQPAVGQLLKQLTDQTRRLAQQEIELAKAELTTKAKAAGIASGLFAGAGLLGLLGLLTLTAAIVLAIATVLPGWAAALIVTAVYLAAAALLGLLGRARMAKATPLAPTQALESVKEDVAWLKNRAKYART